MHTQAQSGTGPWDSVIELNEVTKSFTQWQREGAESWSLANLFRPQKRVLTALDAVSFTVQRGEFVAYAGPNGAGKSTTMKLMCGMLTPNQGTVKVLGLGPVRDRIRIMQKTGVLFGNRTELWGDHPLESSFEWKRAVWDIDRKDYERTRAEVVELLDLSGMMKTFSRELSLGQRLRADLALMLLHEPELILLDEPTLGLDVVNKRAMIAYLKRLHREKGTTIIVTSHDMDDLEEMADRMLIIAEGKLAFDGQFRTLRERIGLYRKVSIRTRVEQPPMLAGLEHVESQQGTHVYRYNAQEMDIKRVLQAVMEMPEVEDVELSSDSLEEMIAGLFLKWRKEGTFFCGPKEPKARGIAISP